MKNYTITVNGNVYDVTVEEGQSETTGVTKKATQTAKAPVKETAAKKTITAGTTGAVKINAPMPGKILSVKASANTAIKKGEVIMILEAMKMENEIVAPQDGSVASINVAVGQTVETGEILASLN